MPFRRRDTPGPLSVGDVVAGRYELRELLGGGGMGNVYRAFDRELERELAVKALLSHVATDPEFGARFRREGQALARMRHPNIIGLYDMLRPPEGGVFLLLELVRGRSLDGVLGAGPSLRWSRCAEIGAQVCAALAAAHAAGVIHRDIKPSNILIEEDGTARVADFGVARLAGAGGTTQAGMSIGTPEYFSPEQAEGREVSERSDLYSLCVVLFEAATGRLPYESAEGARAVALMHMSAPVPDPREVNPTLPEAAAALIRRGLEKDPADRFESARELADALRSTRDLPQAAPPRRPAAQTLVSAPPPIDEPAAARVEEPTEAAPVVDEPDRASPVVAAPTAPPPARAPVVTRLRRRTREGAAADAAPPRRPAAPTVLRRRHAGPALVAAAIALVALAAVGGYLLGNGGENAPPSPPAPAGARSVSSGGITVNVPADWASGVDVVGIPGLGLSENLSFAPPEGRLAGGMAIGRSRGSGPTLLPGTLLERLAPGSPDGQPVALGAAEALRYTDLIVRGLSGSLTIYAVPTDDGIATLACTIVEPDRPGTGAACQAAARSFALARDTVFQLDPSPIYARALNGALRRLATARGAGLDALRAASSRGGQGAASRRVAGAYSTAAGALADVEPGPARERVHATLILALASSGRAFSAMASAAQRGDGAGFDRARRAARSADQRLDAALKGVRALGYSGG